MAKTCAEIFAGLDCTILGNADVEIAGLKYRSDQVEAGDAFFCIVGEVNDGHSFAQDAIDRGAKVLVVERKVYLADASEVTEVVVRDSRKAMARAAAAFNNFPSDSFQLVGVTGTNGKTTTTYLVGHVAELAGKKCGIIGTTGVRVGDKVEELSFTTPEATDLQALFARMRDNHCQTVAIEVSSSALKYARTWDSKFAVTAFTNLSQDHLDVHHTFEDYFESKAKLFSNEYPARRVICIDDKWGEELFRRCSAAEDQIITTGFSATALIHPLSVEYGRCSTHVQLYVRGSVYDFSYPLVGRFNVSNVMTAFGICLSLGISADTIVSGLESAPGIPGRLERVRCSSDDVSVYVDYAHTPDALEKAIASVKELTPGRTIVVFGCGGNRDRGKRSIMGRISLEADYAVVTSDNPRKEKPEDITADILRGMEGAKDRYEVEPDRHAAIALAIARAEKGDSVLIAGKGHEDYQIIGTEKIHFDDREVAAEELERAGL